MISQRKKSSVRINPLKGRFFDIKPPSEKMTSQKSSFSDFWRFFCIALIAFFALNLGNLYTQSKGLMTESKNLAFAGFDDLQTGIKYLENQEFEKAALLFEGARLTFKELEKSTRYLTGQANRLIDTSLYLDTAEKLIQSGIAVSRIGEELIALIQDSQKIPAVFVSQNKQEGSNIHLTDLIRAQKSRLDRILDESLHLQNHLTTLNANLLPVDLRNKIRLGQQLIGQLIVALGDVEQNFYTVLKLLGDEIPHHYLVLFQNNHELRATGGFIGSIALIEVNDGRISKMEMKDVYELDGQLREFVPAPPGIDQVADQLYLRDANYSPDFPISAQKIMWFLEHSRGPSVDTVIAIDQTIAEKLLEITGPVRLKNFPFQIRADNFNQIFSYHIEAKLSETTSPKQLLFDFIPIIKNQFMTVDRLKKVFALAKEMIQSRHIQAYSGDPEVQKLITRFHLDGKMIAPAPKTDFLAIITTAIGGNKSDQFIKTHIDHQTEISRNGSIINHLTITKNHTWHESDFAKWQTLVDRYGTGKVSLDTLRFIQGEGDNVDYIRVYVPKGSRLITSEGVDAENIGVTEDSGYRVFGFTFGPVAAGTDETVRLQYELPFQLTFQPIGNYRLIMQKQAGAENITFKKTLATADVLMVAKNFPASTAAFSLSPIFEGALEGNQIFLSAITAR